MRRSVLYKHRLNINIEDEYLTICVIGEASPDPISLLGLHVPHRGIAEKRSSILLHRGKSIHKHTIN